MARRGKASHELGKDRVELWLGAARRSGAWLGQDEARPGAAWQGEAGRGEAGHDGARQRKDLGKTELNHVLARHGVAWLGEASALPYPMT